MLVSLPRAHLSSAQPAYRSGIDVMIAHAVVKDRECTAQPAHRPTLLDPACTFANTLQGLIRDLQ
jgi:hypothetical protein